MAWVVPAGYRVYPPRLNITAEILDRHVAAGNGDMRAVVWQGGEWSYSDLQFEVCRLAAGYRTLGVMPGDAVLLRSRNTPLACAAILAVYKLGAVAAITSTLLQEQELGVILEAARPKLVVVQDAASELPRLLAESGQIEQLLLLDGAASGSREVSANGFPPVAQSEVPTVDTAADDPALLFFSSGTTGRPKGIVHAHRWLAAMGDVIRLQMAYEPGDVALTPGEYCFMATWGHCLVAPLYAGATVGLYSDRPNPRTVLETVAALGVTKFMAVPTFYRMVLTKPDTEAGLDLSQVTAWMCGGEELGASTTVAWRERFNHPLYDMYGITEMQVVIGNGPDIELRPGSIGKLLPGIALSLRDEALNEVPDGESGRVMIRRSDPGMFLHYHNDWNKWRAAHCGDFYDTGDMMRRDADGYYWYVGRGDDLFKSRGMFISPGEIEDAVLRHPAVADCVVIGAPDPRIGNQILAFVVARPGIEHNAELEDDILGITGRLIAEYKVPHEVRFVESLPKSTVGKTVRRVLRAALEAPEDAS